MIGFGGGGGGEGGGDEEEKESDDGSHLARRIESDRIWQGFDPNEIVASDKRSLEWMKQEFIKLESWSRSSRISRRKRNIGYSRRNIVGTLISDFWGLLIRECKRNVVYGGGSGTGPRNNCTSEKYAVPVFIRPNVNHSFEPVISNPFFYEP